MNSGSVMVNGGVYINNGGIETFLNNIKDISDSFDNIQKRIKKVKNSLENDFDGITPTIIDYAQTCVDLSDKLKKNADYIRTKSGRIVKIAEDAELKSLAQFDALEAIKQRIAALLASVSPFAALSERFENMGSGFDSLSNSDGNVIMYAYVEPVNAKSKSVEDKVAQYIGSGVESLIDGVANGNNPLGDVNNDSLIHNSFLDELRSKFKAPVEWLDKANEKVGQAIDWTGEKIDQAIEWTGENAKKFGAYWNIGKDIITYEATKSGKNFVDNWKTGLNIIKGKGEQVVNSVKDKFNKTKENTQITTWKTETDYSVDRLGRSVSASAEMTAFNAEYNDPDSNWTSKLNVGQASFEANASKDEIGVKGKATVGNFEISNKVDETTVAFRVDLPTAKAEAAVKDSGVDASFDAYLLKTSATVTNKFDYGSIETEVSTLAGGALNVDLDVCNDDGDMEFEAEFGVLASARFKVTFNPWEALTDWWEEQKRNWEVQKYVTEDLQL